MKTAANVGHLDKDANANEIRQGFVIYLPILTDVGKEI